MAMREGTRAVITATILKLERELEGCDLEIANAETDLKARIKNREAVSQRLEDLRADLEGK